MNKFEDMNEMVILIDEDGNEKQVPADEAVLGWIEHYGFEECFDIMLEYLSLGDVQKMLVETMTIEQKLRFLEKESELYEESK